MQQPIYQQISAKFQAYQNCIKNNNDIWRNKHVDNINGLIENYLPHGSGIDSDIELDFDNSKHNKLIFTFEYHHMDQNGFYCEWESYKLIVTPSLSNKIELKIIGKNKNFVKDYLYEIFDNALRKEIDYPYNVE